MKRQREFIYVPNLGVTRLWSGQKVFHPTFGEGVVWRPLSAIRHPYVHVIFPKVCKVRQIRCDLLSVGRWL